MIFTKDSTFLNLVRGERDQENYGITHTIKHVFVDQEEKTYYYLVISLNVDLVETQI